MGRWPTACCARGCASSATGCPAVLLRGEFFDGWNPGRVPVAYDVAEFCERFAAEAGIHQSQVADAAVAVSTALDTLCSAGNLDHVLARDPLGSRRRERW
ncbi:DUF2267 domain-containing protein [Amycolatopsis sp. NPDC049159]|uniref:DUF2267 domain-containing protein n=1 Tax=Amycolatopsis sp. NPDC049159 TaxID=3157210 RepID=UPI0033F1C7B2